MKKLILFNIALFASALTLFSQNQISTYPANTANNGTGGITFELEVLQAITLDELWSQTFSAGTSTWTFWYKPGSYFGQQTVSTANGWTQVSTGVSASGSGSSGAPVLFVGNIGITLQPGKYGIHMTTSNIGYKSWVSSSQDVFTDNFVIIRNGQNYGYGGGTANSFHPRQFCGIVKYTPLASVPNDAGVTSIDSPEVFCSGAQNIVATIRNFGTNQVNPVTVNWSVNGFQQTPVVYNQTLDTLNGLGSQDAQITLGSWNFTSGQTDTLYVWTTLPNGQIDTVNMNDSAMALLQPSLSGTFTIDTAATADYQTFSAAVQDLNDYGVCGPVTFNVGAGVYNEQVTIDDINGASEINSIKFIGTLDSAGNPTADLQFAASSSASRWTVFLNNAKFISFENLSFSANGTTYSNVFDVSAGCSDITFDNCHFNGYSSATTSTFQALFYGSSGTNTDNCKFWNNTFNHGSYAFYYFGGSSAGGYSPGIEFIGNSFMDQYYRIIYYLYYCDGFKINNNTFRSSRNYSSLYALYLITNQGACEVIGNDIIIPGYYGIYVSTLNGTPNESPIIANNMVSVGVGAGTAGYVTNFNGMTFTRVVNNTFVGAYSSYPYSVLRISSGSFNTVLNNNVYADKTSTSSSYAALYYGSTGVVEVSDYNNVWKNGSGYAARAGSAYLTMNDYITATGLDTNSLSTDPMYTDLSDPRTCSDTLDGAAMPLAYITDDFEGDGRDPATPDIGADEFVGSKTYSAGADGYVCSGKGVVIGLQSNNLDSISWSTGDTTATIKVFNPGTYTVTVKASCGDTTQSDEVVVTDLTAEANFTSVVDYTTGKFTQQAVNKDSLVWYVHTNPVDTFFGDVVTYIFPDNGPYDVTLCVYNECDTVCSTQEWNGFVGINETSLNNKISLMPNPATDDVNIKFNGFEGSVTVELHNIQGQVVYSERYNVIENAVESIDVSGLNKGMYILKFMSNDEVSTKQLIVQ